MTAALADDLGDVLLAVAKLVDQRLIAGRLLERIEVGALHVLDDRELQRLVIVHVERNDRNLMQTGALRRAPAPLAGDDLEGVGVAARRANHDRLHDAALADRGGELVELGIRKIATWITRVGLEKFDRNAALSARALGRGGFGADVADERGKPAA